MQAHAGNITPWQLHVCCFNGEKIWSGVRSLAWRLGVSTRQIAVVLLNDGSAANATTKILAPSLVPIFPRLASFSLTYELVEASKCINTLAYSKS